MTFQRFEELEIWKNSRLLCKMITDVSNNSSLSKDFSLREQILRSSGSVMDNIAEGYERDGKKNLFSFYMCCKRQSGGNPLTGIQMFRQASYL